MSDAITKAKVFYNPATLERSEIETFIRSFSTQPADSGRLHIVRQKPTLEGLKTLMLNSYIQPDNAAEARKVKAIQENEVKPDANILLRIAAEITSIVAKIDKDRELGRRSRPACTSYSR